MNSATVQFVAVAAVAAAWAWLFGRPVMTNLLRRGWEDRPAPVASWRAQALDVKRLQMLMASALATFAALLLSIALRGAFFRLFVLMAAMLVIHLGVAVYFGSIRLREFEEQARLRRAERRRAAEAERQLLDGVFDRGSDGRTSVDTSSSVTAADPIDAGVGDEPGLRFAPLDLDLDGDLDLDHDVAAEPATSPRVAFKAAPAPRKRPARDPKARPVHIEPSRGDSSDDQRVVND